MCSCCFSSNNDDVWRGVTWTRKKTCSYHCGVTLLIYQIPFCTGNICVILFAIYTWCQIGLACLFITLSVKNTVTGFVELVIFCYTSITTIHQTMKAKLTDMGISLYCKICWTLPGQENPWYWGKKVLWSLTFPEGYGDTSGIQKAYRPEKWESPRWRMDFEKVASAV